MGLYEDYFSMWDMTPVIPVPEITYAVVIIAVAVIAVWQARRFVSKF